MTEPRNDVEREQQIRWFCENTDTASGVRFLLSVIDDLREQVARSAKDSERLDAFADMLVESAGTTLTGMVEVVFSVDPPDGGSVSVGLGLNPGPSASSAAEAFRQLCDELPGASPVAEDQP